MTQASPRSLEKCREQAPFDREAAETMHEAGPADTGFHHDAIGDCIDAIPGDVLEYPGWLGNDLLGIWRFR